MGRLGLLPRTTTSPTLPFQRPRAHEHAAAGVRRRLSGAAASLARCCRGRRRAAAGALQRRARPERRAAQQGYESAHAPLFHLSIKNAHLANPIQPPVSIGSRFSPAAPVNLLAVAREGAHEPGEGGALLHIYDLYGSLLVTHATGHAAPVTCISFEGGGGGGGEPTVACLSCSLD